MKAKVHFSPSPEDYIRKGHGAFIYPKDHPSPLVSNTKIVHTTPVMKLHADGSFETENTLYIPYYDIS